MGEPRPSERAPRPAAADLQAQPGTGDPTPRRCRMSLLQPAQAGAQLLSLIVFGTMAIWYVAPWLKTRARADALIPLLWIHVFRYVALQAFSAQRDGFPISDGGLMEIVLGDVGGVAIAL